MSHHRNLLRISSNLNLHPPFIHLNYLTNCELGTLSLVFGWLTPWPWLEILFLRGGLEQVFLFSVLGPLFGAQLSE